MKNYLNPALGIILASFLVAGCRKEIVNPVVQTNLQHGVTSGNSGSRGGRSTAGESRKPSTGQSDKVKLTTIEHNHDGRNRLVTNFSSDYRRLSATRIRLSENGKKYTYEYEDYTQGTTTAKKGLVKCAARAVNMGRTNSSTDKLYAVERYYAKERRKSSMSDDYSEGKEKDESQSWDGVD